MLRALQTGELVASDIFDPELYGRFLALVDLWGATEATSLINLRFYCNPATQRLEPIGFNANALGSDERLDLGAAHNDPVLQAAYAREAWRISRPEYMSEMRAALEPVFAQLAEAVSAISGEIEPPWDELRRRQELIRLSLDPVQPVFAYLGAPDLTRKGLMRIDVANVLNLPVEILYLDINGATNLSVDRRWLHEDSLSLSTGDGDGFVLRAHDTAQAPITHYATFLIPLTEILRQDDEFDFMQEVNVRVVTRILGLSNEQATSAQPGYPDVFTDAGQ
jgi:hypothetical protein